MKIDRHNYEEYFILYMDNELGSDDRRMVEAFVLQHPDLKEELDLLLQYKLTPDTEILFPGKEDLIKVNGETPITLTNYEEWLVLYIDNELNADQRKAVESFMAVNPSIQDELTLLQHSKLQPEQIVFAGKEFLYRKEEKVRPLPVRWWRIAAAAVLLLGIGITTAVVVNKKSSGGGEFVKNTVTEKKTNPVNPVITPVKKENTPVNEIAVADNVRQTFTPSVKQDNKQDNKNINVVKNNKPVVKDKVPANIQAPIKKEEPVFVDNNNKPSNNLPQPINNFNINKNNATTDVAVNVTPSKEITNPKESVTPVTNVIAASYNSNNDAAQLEEGGNNKKNRGFLRKLTRTFEKRTNMTATDDDKLLVGGLAFKLK
jgi:hypothetical protein